MSRKCQLTGKCAKSGHTVSHSNIKTKRLFMANIQEKNVLNPATGKFMRIRIATSALRTLNKWRAAGKKFDLRKLIQS